MYARQLEQSKQHHPKMGVKIGWMIADLFGGTFALLGIFSNLDNIKSTILAFLAMIYLLIRTVYFLLEKEQKRRSAEIDLWHKEQDKQERIAKKSHS